MGTVLVTVEYGKEKRAAAEVLDCILPLDAGACVRESGFGGLLILETSLDPDFAASSVARSCSALVRGIVPVDLLVPSDLRAIEEASIRIAGKGSVAVRCRRRGSQLPPAMEVEGRIGRALAEHGFRVDLDDPDQVVRIEIIGEMTAVSIRSPRRSLLRRACGCKTDGQDAHWQGP